MIGRYVVFLAVVLGVLLTAVARKSSAPTPWPEAPSTHALPGLPPGSEDQHRLLGQSAEHAR